MKCANPLILIQLDYHLESHDAITFGSKLHCPLKGLDGEAPRAYYLLPLKERIMSTSTAHEHVNMEFGF